MKEPRNMSIPERKWWSSWWEVPIAGLFIAIHAVAWWGQLGANEPMPDIDTRALGASSMTDTATAGITAVSILLPAAMLVIQFSRDPAGKLAQDVAFQSNRGTWLLSGSLIAGLLVLWLVPMQSQVENVARNFWTGTAYGVQLILLLVGLIRVVLGIRAAVKREVA
jgi:hypothetical protein